MEIRIFQHKEGKAPFEIWLGKLRDKRAKAKILVRLDRIKMGNFGDIKAVGGGVQELRVKVGKGYRVYLGMKESQVVILLCGGDKATQQDDIKQAKKYWSECNG